MHDDYLCNDDFNVLLLLVNEFVYDENNAFRPLPRIIDQIYVCIM